MRISLAFLFLAAGAAAQPSDLSWNWEGGARWIEGVGNDRAFDGGLGFGARYGGAAPLDPAAIPPVRIVFDQDLESIGRSFDVGDGLADIGRATFGGAAYDVSDPDAPRRLNVGIYEDSRRAPPDFRWAPTAEERGGNEYLVVFMSAYDQGTRYADQTAYGTDIAYGLRARAVGRGLYSSPAAITATPSALRDVRGAQTPSGGAVVEWTAARYADAATVRVRRGSQTLAAATAADGVVVLSGLAEAPVALTVESLDAVGDVIAERALTLSPTPAVGVGSATVRSPLPRRDYGDVWGYTAPDGTEYALLTARGAGLAVLDLSASPAAPPTAVGFAPMARGARDAKDVKVYGHHAYVVHEVGPVQIVDLSDPASPTEAGRLNVQPDLAFGGSHNAAVADGHLWVVGGSTVGNAGLRVYSLADPASPTLVGSFRPDHHAVPYYHDVEIRGGRAYAAAIYDGGGVDVLDVSDPSAISLVSTFTYPGAGAHNTCTSEDGNTVYVGDEIGASGNWMRIFDVTDVQDAELVGEIVINESAAVHNCYVRGDRLFVAHYTEGLRVFDVSEPHFPIEVVSLDTFGGASRGYRGAWTAYPYFASGKVIVSDIDTGLWVATLDEVPPPPPLPDGVALQARPNPARGSTLLAYELGDEADVRLVLLDVRGREVAVVEQGVRQRGRHAPVADVAGLPAGVYLAVLTVNGERAEAASVTVVR